MDRRKIFLLAGILLTVLCFQETASGFWLWSSKTSKFTSPKKIAKQTPQAQLEWALSFYQAKDYSRDRIRVLLRLDVSKMPKNAEVHRTDGDFPLAWAKMYGKGRVFYSSFAHDSKTWDNPDVYHMYLEAIKWALGMSDADITPRPLPAATTVNATPAR